MDWTPIESVQEMVRSFVGVKHRFRWVATVGDVQYFCKAKVLLIAGGRDNKVPWLSCCLIVTRYCVDRRSGQSN